MKKPNYNFGSGNFYTLTQPIEVKIAGTPVTAAPGVGLAPLPSLDESHRPLVVVTGRGKTAGRVSTLVRLRPDVVNEIKACVDAPLYLIVEIAQRRYAQELRARPEGSVEMIRASDLG